MAATLGAALGPDWTAQTLIDWTRRQRPQRLLDNPRDAVAYLRAVLRDVLDGPTAPPHPARRHTELRRALAAAHAVEQREHQNATRAERSERERSAVPRGRRSPAVEAAFAAIRAGTSGRLRRPERAAQLGDAATGEIGCDWPEVAQPGSGLRFIHL